MRKIPAYPLSVLFYLVFGILLLVFHPVQLVCHRIFGYESHRRSVVILNYLIIKSFVILGSKVRFKGFEKLPEKRPLIIVANHQSAWDIPPIVWGFRKHHVKFISKRSLARGIPSISYNLRHGGSIVIDRHNGQQAIRELLRLGQIIEKNNYSACIFPEGTRGKTGKVKKFQPGGIRTLLKAAPSALIVPFAIDGNYKLIRKGIFPLAIGCTLTYSVLDPVEPGQDDAAKLVAVVEKRIRDGLGL